MATTYIFIFTGRLTSIYFITCWQIKDIYLQYCLEKYSKKKNKDKKTYIFYENGIFFFAKIEILLICRKTTSVALPVAVCCTLHL